MFLEPFDDFTVEDDTNISDILFKTFHCVPAPALRSILVVVPCGVDRSRVTFS